MHQHVMLNPSEHKNIKIAKDYSEALGDNLMTTLTFPYEFRNVQSCYPIVFQKDGNSGVISSVALMGFEEGENLFLSEDGWDALYIPMTMRRQPFAIGFQNDNPVISLDINNPRVSTEQGEQLFNEFGGHSDYLQTMTTLLHDIHAGMENAEVFIDALVQYELLEPFSLTIKLNDESDNQLLGFYTINEDKLIALDAQSLDSLHSKGFLLPIYMAVASLSCFSSLIKLKNNQISSAS